jgi:iron complex transport system ATP-binding protein
VLVTHHVEEIPVGYARDAPARGADRRLGLLDDVLTNEALTETFGLPLSVQKRRGRYTAWSR